ncbi:MAG: hypothetical protein Q4C00_06130 [Bacillota bacterium]|nr:hypothetical protein [Bacillota bacterium]
MPKRTHCDTSDCDHKLTVSRGSEKLPTRKLRDTTEHFKISKKNTSLNSPA